MSVITRFAPSPTGFLHIGGARTALFNWLYARHHGGKYLLRIEDTDRARSTDAAVDAIHDGLNWLGLAPDAPPVSQFARRARHRQVVDDLLAAGHAYYCYCTPEELREMRDAARAEGRSFKYDGRWRDRDPAEAPPGVKPAVRLKAPQSGSHTIHDAVQGDVTVQNAEMDDMILLRGDGTPTYMLAVVVDDHDMEVTHIIRGDDHLTNASRQYVLYQALEWEVPVFAHIPLIHGADGAKMSKRHGAVGVDAYRDMGYLPKALRNYLLRLGWSHGDEEIISDADAIQWFDLPAVGRSPSRFDFDKLNSLNAHYLRHTPADNLYPLLEDGLTAIRGSALTDVHRKRVKDALPLLTERVKLLPELVDAASYFVLDNPITFDEKAAKLLTPESQEILAGLGKHLETIETWESSQLNAALKEYAAGRELKLGKVAQPLRAALTGRTVSPGIFDVLAIIGKTESLDRIHHAATNSQ